MVALLDALTQANLTIDCSAVNGGPNTKADEGIYFDNWTYWTEFNYANLTSIFGSVLDQEYHGSREPAALPLDRIVCNEETLEDVLRRFIIPTVNYSLQGQPSICHFGRGSRCLLSNNMSPDWSVFSPRCLSYGQYTNILPGDTKTSAKWSPEFLVTDYNEWREVVTQVTNYMCDLSCRYGFIITDTTLVVLRLTRAVTDTGLALNRPSRENAGHQRQVSMGSVASASTTDTGSVYEDTYAGGWDYHNPEYALIPWAASGRGNLTIKLALWCLAMMASNGGCHINYSYPDLDVWVPFNGRYLNQATGVTKSSVPRGHGLLPSQPSGSSRAPDPAPGQSMQANLGEASGSSTASNYEADAMDVFDDDDDETETVVAGTTKRKSVKQVEIQKRRMTRRLYFIDAKSLERETSRDEWKKVHGGYELESNRHIYFTRRFPS